MKGGDFMCNIDTKKYKVITSDEVEEWGRKYYGHWLVDIQNQENQPKTPVEQFFRYYTQGIHNMFNRVLREDKDMEEYCRESIISPDMIYGAINEMKNNPIQEDVVVYRFVNQNLLKSMLKWSGVNRLRKDTVIFDRAFLSTTLTLEAITSRHYAHHKNTLMKIYVPKGTPCAFLELVSDMQENEVLFLPNTKLRVISRTLFNKYIECIIQDVNEIKD